MKTREPWTICQGVEIQRNEIYHTDKGKKVSSERRLFSTYHSSCFRIESRTTCSTKNSEELRACIEKAYVVVTYSV